MVIKRGTPVVLADGEVFYSVPECEIHSDRRECRGEAKRLIVVNDVPEVVVIPQQSGAAIRDLYELPSTVDLFRDSETPHDQKIGSDEIVDLGDGNVFITRATEGLKIKVNNQLFTETDGVASSMTGSQIAKLVFPCARNPTVKKLTSDGKIEIALNQTVEIANCDEFRVIRPDVNAGFQKNRIDRELAALRAGGARVTLVTEPQAAVIYHDVPIEKSNVTTTTDVLVPIPPGYPAGIPDNAFLPEGSPLINSTVGAVQEVQEFKGKRWQKKSVHPYQGANGVPWDANIHGFHTYHSEILCWLHA